MLNARTSPSLTGDIQASGDILCGVLYSRLLGLLRATLPLDDDGDIPAIFDAAVPRGSLRVRGSICTFCSSGEAHRVCRGSLTKMYTPCGPRSNCEYAAFSPPHASSANLNVPVALLGFTCAILDRYHSAQVANSESDYRSGLRIAWAAEPLDRSRFFLPVPAGPRQSSVQQVVCCNLEDEL